MNQTYPSSESALSPSGRFGRLSYLGWNMLMSFSILIIIGIIAAFFSPNLFNDPSTMTSSSITATVLIGIAYLGLLYFSFVFTIRRLHDRNHTGWLSLFMIVPLLNLIFILYLIFAKGDARNNQYGPRRTTKAWEKVLGWIYVLIFPIGILAAIAIPAYQSYVERAQQVQMEQSIHHTD
ncbi:TMEM128 family protein [Acinetobacter sp.]|uniref:TMEM128 family protein n=1 Tax=Acinetobacter sp. TaxID=472 RepID=UPI0038908D28